MFKTDLEGYLRQDYYNGLDPSDPTSGTQGQRDQLAMDLKAAVPSKYSARWVGNDKIDENGIKMLLDLLNRLKVTRVMQRVHLANDLLSLEQGNKPTATYVSEARLLHKAAGKGLSFDSLMPTLVLLGADSSIHSRTAKKFKDDDPKVVNATLEEMLAFLDDDADNADEMNIKPSGVSVLTDTFELGTPTGSARRGTATSPQGTGRTPAPDDTTAEPAPSRSSKRNCTRLVKSWPPGIARFVETTLKRVNGAARMDALSSGATARCTTGPTGWLTRLRTSLARRWMNITLPSPVRFRWKPPQR